LPTNRSVKIRNIDKISNSSGLVTYEIECNIYFRRHIKRIQMDVCNLEKTDIILGMLWLAAHNSEINWETREVKMTRCSPMCERKVIIKWRKEREENRKDLRWTIKDRLKKKEVIEN